MSKIFIFHLSRTTQLFYEFREQNKHIQGDSEPIGVILPGNNKFLLLKIKYY